MIELTKEDDKKIDEALESVKVKEAQELLIKEQQKKSQVVMAEIQAVLDKHGYTMRVVNNIQLVPKQ